MASDPYRGVIALAPSEAPVVALADRRTISCPACGHGVTEERFCLGGRYGFLWLRRCSERRHHMHQGCNHCGARWLTAPGLAASYE